jgi:hypothetical protein
MVATHKKIMPRDRLLRIIINYAPKGRRNQVRPLTLYLLTWKIW